MVKVRTSTVFANIWWWVNLPSAFIKYRRGVFAGKKKKPITNTVDFLNKQDTISHNYFLAYLLLATLSGGFFFSLWCCFILWYVSQSLGVLWITVDSVCEMVWHFAFVTGFYLRSLSYFSGDRECSITNVGNSCWGVLWLACSAVEQINCHAGLHPSWDRRNSTSGERGCPWLRTKARIKRLQSRFRTVLVCHPKVSNLERLLAL